LITHIDSVRDMLDHVITVRYDPEQGSSTVVQHDGAPDEPLLPDELMPPFFEEAGAAD
jgi:hypothetical protein